MTLAGAARQMIADALADLLDPEDPEAVSIVTGGIWERPLARKGGNRPTLAAFGETGEMLVNIVVPDPGTAPHAQADEVPNAASADLLIWLYAADSDPGYAAIATIRDVLFGLFHDEEIVLDDGSLAFPIWGGELPTRQNYAEFDGSLLGNTRFRVSYVRG